MRKTHTERMNQNREDGSKENCDKKTFEVKMKWTMKELLNEVEYITRVILSMLPPEKNAPKISKQKDGDRERERDQGTKTAIHVFLQFFLNASQSMYKSLVGTVKWLVSMFVTTRVKRIVACFSSMLQCLHCACIYALLFKEFYRFCAIGWRKSLYCTHGQTHIYIQYICMMHVECRHRKYLAQSKTMCTFLCFIVCTI